MKYQNLAIEQEQSFDPWGRKRNPTNWSYNNIPAFTLLDRGYTGHACPERSRREHLNEFNLINMNSLSRLFIGRCLYDPILGRVLSPDPALQLPANTQNYNRYSYCLNNPLKYNDPSGNIMALPTEYRQLGVSRPHYRINDITDYNPGGWGGNPATGDGGGGGAWSGVLPKGIDEEFGTGCEGFFKASHTWVNGTESSGWVNNSEIKSYQIVEGWTGTPSLITLKDYYLKEIDPGANRDNPPDGGGIYMVNGQAVSIPRGMPVPPGAKLMKVGGFETQKSLDLINQNGGIEAVTGSKPLGPVGVGLGFKIAIPSIAGYPPLSYSYSFGYIADIRGIGVYETTGHAKSGWAFSFGPECFYVHGINKPATIFTIKDEGYTGSAGVGRYGLDVSTDREGSSYYQVGFSNLGMGVDLNMGTWETNTVIYTNSLLYNH